MNQQIHFGALEPEFREYASSRVAILPIPYEATTTFLKGTRHGPRALLEASPALEFYDEELDTEPYRVGIHTCPEVDVHSHSGGQALAHIEEAAESLLADGKFVVGIGGEHTVTIGLVRAHARRHPGLTVIQLDAHADLRDAYEGSPYNHACVMRRILEICPAVQIGIRAMDRLEVEHARAQGLSLYLAWHMRRDPSWLERALTGIRGPVYVTVDLDVMDPALLPAVGTPEPGGLGWYEALEILRRIFERCQVVGLDLVELRPRAGLEASSFIAAKLLYKLIGYRFGLALHRA